MEKWTNILEHKVGVEPNLTQSKTKDENWNVKYIFAEK